MTNIFSSKQTRITELEAKLKGLEDAVKSKETLIADLEAKLKLQDEAVKSKEDFSVLKAEFDTTIETMKTEFNTAVNGLNERIANLNKEKADVVENATKEIASAKEIKKEEVTAKVNEGVATKIAAMGLPANELPITRVTEQQKKDRFTIKYTTTNPSQE